MVFQKKDEAAYMVKYLDEKTIAVDGLSISKVYILFFYYEMRSLLDESLALLGFYFINPISVVNVACMWLFYDNINIRDSISSSVVFFNLFSTAEREKMFPCINANTYDKDEVINNINKWLSCLMWVIELTIPGHARFSDLKILKDGDLGNNRKLLIDPRTRIINIYMTYCKARSYRPILKV